MLSHTLSRRSLTLATHTAKAATLTEALKIVTPLHREFYVIFNIKKKLKKMGCTTPCVCTMG